MTKYSRTINLSDQITLELDTSNDDIGHAAEWMTRTPEGDLLMVAHAKEWTACSRDELAKLWRIGIWWKHADGADRPRDFLELRYRTHREAVSALASRYRAVKPELF